MVINSYRSQAELLRKEYIFADLFAVFSSVIIGIFACKMVYDLCRLISAVCFKGYTNLSKSKQIEWNNRAMSTVHALFISTVSMYFTFWSDLYSDNLLRGPITLEVSVGYFLSDLAMIIWFYPSLGTMEYVIHHLLSVVGVSYAMLNLTGEAQLYTFMVLTSEATTPGINLRCWNEEVQGIYYKWSCNILGMAGEADAYKWDSLGASCSLSDWCYEFNLVLENIQRIEEDAGEDAVVNTASSFAPEHFSTIVRAEKLKEKTKTRKNPC
ncbi:hypothetical protein DH2020_024983 [Rehmannia glutinosa]|uniref:TLC domain-containing protein n=1 Tax=Rehmannia glutinosa TaxID=99300 RepID=A0ABR0W4V3_REHGL